jgi:hypothetical protein
MKKYVDSDGNYFYKLKLENGSEFTVEKELVIIFINLSKQ